MNHKRRRRKNARAGCLWCKPHKANGRKGAYNARTQQDKVALLRFKEQQREIGGATGQV